MSHDVLVQVAYFVTDGKIFYSRSTVLKLPSALLKNCISIFIYFYINNCFA